MIDDDGEEDNQLEVSPEPSKTMSLAKRFKFSPGMLMKQSQDDVVDEVTWKISPVNERLHSISKHVRVLADSSRFNSMNFQPCSQRMVQTSPGRSGKLERWLSSPPLKACERSLICFDNAATRKSKSDDDVNSHGNNSNTISNRKPEVHNSQSPFTTPPSLSCCPDKVRDDTDSSGMPDQLGSRQHKKALIELLDQVEDVISEDSSCRENKTLLDADRPLNNGLAVNSSTRNLKENCRKSSNFNFLVLEVCDELSVSQSHFKVLRLLNEESGVERALQLWDDWSYSIVSPGDFVHVIGEFDAQREV